MSALTKNQIDHLAQRLHERRTQLRSEIMEVLGRTGEHPYGELAAVPDPGDASTADLLIDIDNAMVHRDVQEVRDIDATLRRIDEGSYGDCTDCGLAIEYERLQAFPTAKRCVLCQGQYEKTHVHDATPTL